MLEKDKIKTVMQFKYISLALLYSLSLDHILLFFPWDPAKFISQWHEHCTDISVFSPVITLFLLCVIYYPSELLTSSRSLSMVLITVDLFWTTAKAYSPKPWEFVALFSFWGQKDNIATSIY